MGTYPARQQKDSQGWPNFVGWPDWCQRPSSLTIPVSSVLWIPEVQEPGSAAKVCSMRTASEAAVEEMRGWVLHWRGSACWQHLEGSGECISKRPVNTLTYNNLPANCWRSTLAGARQCESPVRYCEWPIPTPVRFHRFACICCSRFWSFSFWVSANFTTRAEEHPCREKHDVTFSIRFFKCGFFRHATLVLPYF